MLKDQNDVYRKLKELKFTGQDTATKKRQWVKPAKDTKPSPKVEQDRPRTITNLGNCVLYVKGDRNAVVSWGTKYIQNDAVGVIASCPYFRVIINGIVHKPLDFLSIEEAEACALLHTS